MTKIMKMLKLNKVKFSSCLFCCAALTKNYILELMAVSRVLPFFASLILNVIQNCLKFNNLKILRSTLGYMIDHNLLFQSIV